jgi:hypothetical protein
MSDQPLGNEGPPGYYAADLAQICTYYHKHGCALVALLDQLRAARIVAQAQGDADRLAAIDTLLHDLPDFTYTRGPQPGSWTISHPLYGSQTSVPTLAWESKEPT